MVKWIKPRRTTTTTTTTTAMRAKQPMSTRLLLTIVIVIASLVRVINGFLPIELNAASEGRAIGSGTDSRRAPFGARIAPKQCRATKQYLADPHMAGPTICMFNHECAQRKGKVVGACMDGFLFGACCQVPKMQQVESTLINDAQNVYYQQFQQKVHTQQVNAAQSFENYGENAQSSTEQYSPSYDTTKHDFATINSYRPDPPISTTSSSISSSMNHRLHETQSISYISSTQTVKPQVNRKKTNHVRRPANIRTTTTRTTTTSTTTSPPKVYLNRDPVTSSQSFQNYGENTDQPSQLSTTEQQIGIQKLDITTISSYDSEASASSTFPSSSSTLNNRLHETPSISYISSTKPAQTKVTKKKPQNTRRKNNASRRPTKVTTTTTTTISPLKSDVKKDSVKISTPPSSTLEEDTVQKVQSTLPSNGGNDIFTFSPETPMKISATTTDGLSSEFNSVEEEVSNMPIKLKDKTTTPKTTQKDSTKAQEQTIEPLKRKQTTKPQKSHIKQQQSVSSTPGPNSSLPYADTDADSVEDLQFSTGYGPVPAYAEPPKAESLVSGYESDSNTKRPQDDQYVLVETISNDQPYKQPLPLEVPATDSAITTHVDSIESIILQLNNSNSGPVYSVIDHNDQSYGSGTTLSLQSENTANKQGYASSTSAATTSVEPLQSAPTMPSYFEEIETKRPQESYTGLTGKIPAYLETVTTNLNYIPEKQYIADLQTSAISNPGPSSYNPDPEANSSDETTSELNVATMPNKNYNDVADSYHQTSDFNKMPVMGIAYPVDMSLMEEDGNLNAEESGYQKVSIPTSSQKPEQDSTVIDTYYTEPEQSSTQSETIYTRLPTISDSITHKHPETSKISLVTAPNYIKQPQNTNYNQVPEEVSVTSHTTKVQEADDEDDNDLADFGTAQTQKLTTISYVDTTTTISPLKTGLTTFSYTTSESTSHSRPPYDSLVLSSSASRPKPSSNKGPNIGNNKKKSTPPVTRRPSTSNTKLPQNDYIQSEIQSTVKQQSTPSKKVSASTYGTSTVSYMPRPTDGYAHQSIIQKQPNNDYSSLVLKPSDSYGQDSFEQLPSTTYKAPNQQSASFNKEQLVSNPPVKKTATRKPNPSKRPISSSHFTRPVTSRPPTTSAYEHEVPPLIIANDKLDTFPQSTAESVAELPSPLENANLEPVHASAITPLQIQSVYNGHNRPMFVRIKASTRRPASTFITPKPSPGAFVKQPSSDSYDPNYRPFAEGNKQPNADFNDPSYGLTTVGIKQSNAESYDTSYAPTTAGVKRPNTDSYDPNYRPTTAGIKKPSLDSYESSYGPSTVGIKQANGESIDINNRPGTTSSPQFASTSYVYSPTITRRPEFTESSSEHINMQAQNSNDFFDPGYFGSPPATKPTYAIPSDDRPAFPGYFGPTPAYPAFQIPGEKNDGTIEESYTSPNDFVNFPPVRNPNLNMSATSSAVTSDLDLSTPAFVEDGVLKEKMNTLVHKIAESLQDNFQALSEIIDETDPSAYQAGAIDTTTIVTRKPTKKPVNTKTKATTTKKPATRTTTKATTKKPATTRKPSSRRTTTKKPATTKKTTKKPTPTTTTNAAPFQDEIVDEEDGEDINESENEIGDTNSLGVGSNGRRLQCGVRPHVKSGRIVGGKGSTFGAYPWQVLVRESTWLGLFTKNKCGGVLITNKYVITAAHCQPGFLASLVAVMGEFDISGDLESKKPVTKNVKRVIVHRQYDPATFENDLALLELESPVQFDTHIVPICMPNDSADFTGRMATVTGWGRLKYGGGVPSVLQEVQVPIIENSVCQEMFHTAGHNKKILNSFLCAGYANGQKDSCEGDSGGPLVLQRPDGRYELAGTVSHGIKCAAPYLPGVYMRTTYYKPWLRSITGVK